MFFLQSTVDKLFQKTQSSLLIGTSSWKDQFIEAFKVMADDEGDDDEEGTIIFRKSKKNCR